MRQVAYALLTRPPLSMNEIYRSFIHSFLARLACIRHAASVHPEPGSNSFYVVFIGDLSPFESILISDLTLCARSRFEIIVFKNRT